MPGRIPALARCSSRNDDPPALSGPSRHLSAIHVFVWKLLEPPRCTLSLPTSIRLYIRWTTKRRRQQPSWSETSPAQVHLLHLIWQHVKRLNFVHPAFFPGGPSFFSPCRACSPYIPVTYPLLRDIGIIMYPLPIYPFR